MAAAGLGADLHRIGRRDVLVKEDLTAWAPDGSHLLGSAMSMLLVEGKHTRFIVRDLPSLVEQGIGRLMEKWHDQSTRINAYREKRIGNPVAHDLVIRATDVGVCSNRQIPAILDEWRSPRYEDFKRRNVWSLFNAFTEILKDGSLTELPKRTEALHGLLDCHVGLAGRFSAN